LCKMHTICAMADVTITISRVQNAVTSQKQLDCIYYYYC
jgi:hypothetical protein